MNLSQEEKEILNQIVKITFKGNVVLENKNFQKKIKAHTRRYRLADN